MINPLPATIFSCWVALQAFSSRLSLGQMPYQLFEKTVQEDSQLFKVLRWDANKLHSGPIIPSTLPHVNIRPNYQDQRFDGIEEKPILATRVAQPLSPTAGGEATHPRWYWRLPCDWPPVHSVHTLPGDLYWTGDAFFSQNSRFRNGVCFLFLLFSHYLLVGCSFFKNSHNQSTKECWIVVESDSLPLEGSGFNRFA